MNNTKLKLMFAGAGGSAVIAMGAMSAGFGESNSAEPAAPGPATTTPEIPIQTVTETPPPETPTTTIAEPSITGTPPLPPELNGVPG